MINTSPKLLVIALWFAASGNALAEDRIAGKILAAGDTDRSSVFLLNPQASQVDVLVYRGGLLARFGHDHVISVGKLEGAARVAESDPIARADLEFAVSDLIVDDPGAREAAGFDSRPTDEDRAGTYGNLLRSLSADEYPLVRLKIESESIDWPLSRNEPGVKSGVSLSLEVEVEMHGVTQKLPIDALIDILDEGFRATGEFSIAQKDFGIRPFRALAGALAVGNKVDIRFDLVFSPGT